MLIPLAAADAADAAAQGLAPVRVQAERTEREGSLVLSWPVAVASEVERDGRELTLRFDRPLGAAPLETLPERLSGWVDNVLYGYDSLLLVLGEGVDARVEPFGRGVRIGFEPGAPDPRTRRAEEEARREAERRLDYFRAVTLLEEGHVLPARRLLSYLVAADPADAPSVALLASAEARLGRWRQALRLYDRALELTPEERGLIQARLALVREHGDRVQLDTDAISVSNGDEHRLQTLTGRHELGMDTGLRYRIEHRAVEQGGPPVVRPPPPPGAPPLPPLPERTFERTRAELALVRDWPALESSRVSLFLAERTLGAGLAQTWRDGNGAATTATLRWNEPYWDLLEGVRDGGRRHRLAVAHERTLAPRWSMALGVGYNVYGLPGEPDLARTATVEGTLRHVLSEALPQLSLAYTLDGEYVERRAEGTDPLGNPVTPLPLTTREVHALSLALDDALSDFLRYSLQVGYAYDRYNAGAPFASASLAWTPLDALEVGLRAARAVNPARGTRDTSVTLGGYLMWRY